MTSAIRTVGLVPHRERALAHELAGASGEMACRSRRRPVRRAGGRRRSVRPRTPRVRPSPSSPRGSTSSSASAATAPCCAPSTWSTKPGVPVLGVNVGAPRLPHRGRARARSDQTRPRALLAGEYDVDERTDAPGRRGDERAGVGGVAWALNEAVLEKVQSGRSVRLDVLINGTFFTPYAADGVIVADADRVDRVLLLGTWADRVAPTTVACSLTPVSPHMLFDRALVLGADEELAHRASSTSGSGGRSPVDGRVLGTLEPGDAVTCRAAPRPARLVTFGPRDFHQILKAKFGLADRRSGSAGADRAARRRPRDRRRSHARARSRPDRDSPARPAPARPCSSRRSSSSSAAGPTPTLVRDGAAEARRRGSIRGRRRPATRSSWPRVVPADGPQPGLRRRAAGDRRRAGRGGRPPRRPPRPARAPVAAGAGDTARRARSLRGPAGD